MKCCHGLTGCLTCAIAQLARERDAACEEITLMRAELESQERAHAEEKARWAARLRDANRAHAELHERLAWVGHTHYGGRTCAACAAFDAHIAARQARRDHLRDATNMIETPTQSAS